MRKIVFNLHLYTGLTVGLFIVALAVTGSIMAFENELDQAFNPRLFKVEPGAQKLPIHTLEERIENTSTGAHILFFHFGSHPADADYANVRLGDRVHAEIFIDPYSGKIIGQRELPTAFTLIHSFHSDFMMGPIGQVLGAVVSALLVWLGCSGIYLWWPRKRAKIKFGAPLPRVFFDTHNTLGIYSAFFWLLAGLTGLTIFLGSAFAAAGAKPPGPPPLARATRSVSPIAEAGRPISPDAAISAAAKALPGATPFEIDTPTDASKPYYIAMRFPEDSTRGGGSAVLVDPNRGVARVARSSRNLASGPAFATMNRAIHTGDIFGYPTKILMSLSCVLVIFQAFTGYFMWWRKRNAHQQRRAS